MENLNSLAIKKLKEHFPAEISAESCFRGDDTVIIKSDRIVEIMRFLKTDKELSFNMLMDIAGADYLGREPRFEVVYNLYSLQTKMRLRVKVQVPENDPTVDSITGVWKAVNWFEREAYDMFGIKFRNHPCLRRILCHDEFVGHALRKDYPLSKGQWLSGVYDPRGTVPVKEGDSIKAFGESKDLKSKLLTLNLGPSHPAMHGCFRVVLELDGETIVHATPEIGYLHRVFEKSVEKGTYNQAIPYTDRLNYCSPLLNNVGYCLAVEKLIGVEIPERAKYIRVIISEISRIMDHLVCLAASAVDLGALTNFWYFFNAREKLTDIVEKLCGARLTNNYTRVGGLSNDLYDGFKEETLAALKFMMQAIDDVMRLLERNRIFIDRTRGVGVLSPEDAIEYGWTGPCLRACGVNYDVRKAHPYYHYDEFDFEIPLGENGDTYDRFMVRVEEMRQSKRIIEQALERIPPGPVQIDDRRYVLPPKEDVYTNIEGLMNHFMLIMEGLKPPQGEAYGFVEGGNGELGFYVVSDGTGKPYRVKVRPPCFAIYQAYPKIIEGRLIADAIAVMGSLNIIAGELDR